LSLLRSPVNPDPEADRGSHTIQYALYPHSGTFQEGGVISEALALNNPLRVGFTDLPNQERSFFSINQDAVVIDTVKKAEESDSMIIRLFESFGSHVKARFHSSLPVKKAFACNLLEEKDEQVDWKDGNVELEFKPFEIKTLKLIVSKD
jgi:alpha-mannosidase